MGIDGKYGRVTTERDTIGEDEPVIVFRAQDATAVEVLQHYALLCIKAGSPRRHIGAILDAIEVFKNWQALNRTQTPQSQEYHPNQGWAGKNQPPARRIGL